MNLIPNSSVMTSIIRTPRPGAVSCTTIRFVILAAIALQPYVVVEAHQEALSVPQCHPIVVRIMPERIRKICGALRTVWNFNDAMENYLDEKFSLEIQDKYRNGAVESEREDLDHVFLRFGRRI